MRRTLPKYPGHSTHEETVLSFGDNADVIVLEELEHAKARSAQIYAEVVGYGVFADPHQFTVPLPDGDGTLRAIQIALREAKAHPREVNHITAHATGIILGDAAKNAAIKALMLDSASSEVPIRLENVSSIKGLTRYLLGGAGSVKAIFTILAVDNVVRIAIDVGIMSMKALLIRLPT